MIAIKADIGKLKGNILIFAQARAGTYP